MGSIEHPVLSLILGLISISHLRDSVMCSALSLKHIATTCLRPRWHWCLEILSYIPRSRYLPTSLRINQAMFLGTPLWRSTISTDFLAIRHGNQWQNYTVRRYSVLGADLPMTFHFLTPTRDEILNHSTINNRDVLLTRVVFWKFHSTLASILPAMSKVSTFSCQLA